MAMSGGTVTITVDERTGSFSYSGSGLALAFAQAMVPAMLAARDTFFDPITESGLIREWHKAVAFQAMSVANAMPAIVTHVTTNAVGTAHLTTQVVGKTPNPNNPDTNIVPV